MIGYRFAHFKPGEGETTFDKLFNLFKELLVHTSGDVQEAISWLTEIDKEYNLTTNEYGMGDFIEDLKKQGYLQDDEDGGGGLTITSKTEQTIRKDALEQIFGKLKKGGRGQHRTPYAGPGDDFTPERRPFEFGDSLEQIAMLDSIRNAHINHGIDDLHLTQDDLEVMESEYNTNTSTVLMIDISHSMILYGEDRITPAKKVAMALSELIMTKYAKDNLDIIVFGNDAWQITIKDLPFLQVGPYHTNTVAGLELAMDILRRRKNPNKQIFMITDGKPTCLKEKGGYYKNSFGLDRKIINRTLSLAKQCRKLKIPVTTFMIASDPYLKKFVSDFTEINKGKAFYSDLQGLGNLIFHDFENNRRKNY